MKVRRTTSAAHVANLWLLLATLVAGAASVTSEASEKKTKAPAPARPQPRQSLFLARCSSCHSPSRVFHRRAGAAEWREIVNRMRRMPLSGISARDGRSIVAYLISLGRQPTGKRGRVVGGRAAYGDEWLSVLEVAAGKDGVVRLAGRPYRVVGSGLSATLRRAGKKWGVALSSDGNVLATARLDGWSVGKTRYERHLVLYDVRGETRRFAVALRKLP